MISIILAGGSGTRFWPVSRRARPKQLVSLWGERPMLAHAVERLAGLGGAAARVHVVCNAALADLIVDAEVGVARDQIFVEPAARDTAPAIALAAAAAEARYGDEPVGFFPSDHFIEGGERFLACVRRAEAVSRDGGVVTIGIPPTRPETGFGYLKRAEGAADEHGSYAVEAFVEKPDRAKAEAYFADERYAWNAGIFVARPSAIFSEIERQHPDDFGAACAEVRAALGGGAALDSASVRAAFDRMPRISIDFGVMENARAVRLVPATFGWSDLGQWSALGEVVAAGDAGNVVRGRARIQQSENNVVFCEDETKIVALLGVDDLVVVDTADALLVMPRSRAQDVRALVDALPDSHR